MYQLTFRHALLLSTVAHAIAGAACYAGGWLGPLSDVATSETCDGNHIPHIAASIVAELPDTPTNTESVAIQSETTSNREISTQSSTPSISLNTSQAELREKSKEKPHYHFPSEVKKLQNRRETKKIPSSGSENPNNSSVQANTSPGGPQTLPTDGTLGGRSNDASPSYFQNPPPIYPEAARRMRREGIVKLFVTVETNGLPSSITISSSSGHQTLDDAAIRAVQNWKFKPGEINGIAVQSKVEVPIRFSLQ